MVWGEKEEAFRGVVFLRELVTYQGLLLDNPEMEKIETLAEELEDLDPDKVPKLRVFLYHGKAGQYGFFKEDTLLLNALVLLRRSYFKAELVDPPSPSKKESPEGRADFLPGDLEEVPIPEQRVRVPAAPRRMHFGGGGDGVNVVVPAPRNNRLVELHEALNAWEPVIDRER